MKQNRLIEAPTRAGRLSPVVAWFGLAVAAGGVIAARAGDVGPQEVVAVICAGWLISVASVLLAITGLAVVWRQGVPGGGASFQGLVVGCLALLWPLGLGAQLWSSPEQDDVSTDTLTPPLFSEAPEALAVRRFMPAAKPQAGQAAMRDPGQLLALPLFLDLPPAEALKAAQKAAGALGWKMTDEAIAAGGGGQFEAVAKSDLLRFPQYVAVRVQPTADGAQMDVRVASAFARYAPGANVQRILDLHEAVQNVEDD